MSDRDVRIVPFTYEYEEEEPLTRNELKHFEQCLRELRRQLLTRVEEHLDELQVDLDEPPIEVGDRAAHAAEELVDVSLTEQEQRLLDEIDHALEKFKHGTYGFCEGTGRQIARARLELRPWARYSAAYKDELERKQRAQ